ncbi:MAG: hypothetical protein RI988_42 [Pseudomonadota bacterium]|jgi:hypothetical protein
MSEDSQIVIPEAFIDLFRPAGAQGRYRLTETRDVIAARHEFCEDLAQMLTETAQDQLHALGVTPEDVLERIARGLRSPESPVSAPEAGWVVGRLAEVLGWPMPSTPAVTEPGAQASTSPSR